MMVVPNTAQKPAQRTENMVAITGQDIAASIFFKDLIINYILLAAKSVVTNSFYFYSIYNESVNNNQQSEIVELIQKIELRTFENFIEQHQDYYLQDEKIVYCETDQVLSFEEAIALQKSYIEVYRNDGVLNAAAKNICQETPYQFTYRASQLIPENAVESDGVFTHASAPPMEPGEHFFYEDSPDYAN